MGIFDKSKQIEHLESESEKLLKRISDVERFTKQLQKEIQKKASDSEREAAQSSKKAAEFKNKTGQRLEEAINLIAQISVQLNEAIALKNNAESTNELINEKKQLIDEIEERLEQSELGYQEKLENLDARITTIDAFLEKYPELEGQIEEVDENIASIEDNLEKSNVSLTALNKRKKEIDDLHREIFGYTQTDEDGNSTKIEGLKDEIETVYENLSNDIKDALENVEKINSDYTDRYSSFEKGHKDKYVAIISEIESLMPNALTAGLSAAFSKKKEDEVKLSEQLQKKFSTGIYLLIGVSCIPFILSIVFLFEGLALEDAIKRLPRLVLGIIPMYIPVLWFTYSANKKLNLSKRLIEEYAHKEVLSKTYEGLSNQISNIKNSNQSDELKFRLLSNFLQVSSENPGKLISNYEASDHPIMEALEQSYKFQIAIDRLGNIPGIGKVAAILETKAKRKLEGRSDKIEEALASDFQGFGKPDEKA